MCCLTNTAQVLQNFISPCFIFEKVSLEQCQHIKWKTTYDKPGSQSFTCMLYLEMLRIIFTLLLFSESRVSHFCQINENDLNLSRCIILPQPHCPVLQSSSLYKVWSCNIIILNVCVVILLLLFLMCKPLPIYNLDVAITIL